MFGTHVWLCVPMNPYIPCGLFTPPPTMHPQLIFWGGGCALLWPLPSDHFWGVPWSTSIMTTSMMTTSGGTLVHFHDHFHYHFWGVPWSTSMMTTSMMTTSGGVPCDLSHNAVHVISALPVYIVLPQSIMGRSHGTPAYIVVLPHSIMGGSHGTPQSWTDWQTNMSENITFPHYVAGGNDKTMKNSVFVSEHKPANQVYFYILW